MQAFERSERRDRHQASIHSQKRKCQSPQCMATIKRCWIWNSHLICYTGNIYPSTSSLSTRDVSSALQPLSPSAPIAARCGLATASQVVNLESCIWQQLRLGGYFLFSCHKFCMMLFYHIFLQTGIFSASPLLTRLKWTLPAHGVTATLEIQISLLNIETVNVLMDALLTFSEWRSLDWMSKPSFWWTKLDPITLSDFHMCNAYIVAKLCVSMLYLTIFIPWFATTWPVNFIEYKYFVIDHYDWSQLQGLIAALHHPFRCSSPSSDIIEPKNMFNEKNILYICQGIKQFERFEFLSEKINFAALGGSKSSSFEPDTSHP